MRNGSARIDRVPATQPRAIEEPPTVPQHASHGKPPDLTIGGFFVACVAHKV